MRPALHMIAALAIFALGVFAGKHFLTPTPTEQSGLFADPALARAVIEAGAVELAKTDCALGTAPEAKPTVADFILNYASAAELPSGQSNLIAECGGRGNGKCSVTYSVLMGEKADTNILLFTRDESGKLIADDVTCIAQ